MGMAASQVRFLQLTGRKADIGRQLQHLSLEKTALTRDMRKVTQNYQRALSTKSLKWTNNSGVSYTDISYNTLMSPNEYNSKSPILITNSAGKVVVNERYRKYAEMISPDGSVGGVYDGETREKILEALTGISPERMSSYSTTATDVQTAADAANKALAARGDIELKTQTLEADKFIKKFLSPNSLGLSGVTVNKDNVDSIVQKLNSAIVGKNYFTAEQEKNFTDAASSCAETVKNTAATIDEIKESLSKVAAALNSSKKSNTEADTGLSIDDFISAVVGAFKLNLGGAEKIHIMADKNGKGLQSDYDAADKAYQDALAVYDKALDGNNQVYTSEEKTKIDYYDALFTAIVDNGWKYDGSSDDSEYLSQMFQNNQYFVTTIQKNSCYDPDGVDCLRNYDYMYSTDLASNFSNIVAVNDSDLREEALVEYEYQKGIINDKEARIDTRMKNLETEQNAINKMLESIDKVKEDNIERTYGIWA